MEEVGRRSGSGIGLAKFVPVAERGALSGQPGPPRDVGLTAAPPEGAYFHHTRTA